MLAYRRSKLFRTTMWVVVYFLIEPATRGYVLGKRAFAALRWEHWTC